jgi:hypothetical protein
VSRATSAGWDRRTPRRLDHLGRPVLAAVRALGAAEATDVAALFPLVPERDVRATLRALAASGALTKVNDSTATVYGPVDAGEAAA